MKDIKKIHNKALENLPDEYNPAYTGQNLPNVDYRQHPELYRVARGEQGVLTVEPYKSELLAYWRFRTPEIAHESAENLYNMYEKYKDAGDFVGMDMARKYIMMGFTRSMRYANYAGGKKYTKEGDLIPKRTTLDPVKKESASIFKQYWDRILEDDVYKTMMKQHKRIEEDLFL